MNIINWLKNIASSFQPAADKIRKWHLSPELDETFNSIWENLPKNIQKALWDLVKKIYDKYGEEFAVMILEVLLGSLKKKIA